MQVTHTAEIIRDLGDELVLRRTTPADADALAAFNSRIHGEPDAPDLGVGVWTRALIARSLSQLRELGMTEPSLTVDTENPSGALRLYEGLGYRPVKRGSVYRKPLD